LIELEKNAMNIYRIQEQAFGVGTASKAQVCLWTKLVQDGREDKRTQ
jgi:hypothetical protein